MSQASVATVEPEPEVASGRDITLDAIAADHIAGLQERLIWTAEHDSIDRDRFQMTAHERGAVGLSLLLAAIGLYQGAQVLTDHLASADFPAHARFHAALGGAYMILVSLVAVWITWSRGLRRAGHRLLLPVVLLLLPVGFLGAIGVVPSGSPGSGFVNLAAAVTVAVFAVAVLLRMDTNKRDEPDP